MVGRSNRLLLSHIIQLRLESFQFNGALHTATAKRHPIKLKNRQGRAVARFCIDLYAQHACFTVAGMYVSPSSLQSISLRPASAKKAGNQTNQQPGLSSHTGTLSQSSKEQVSRSSNTITSRIPFRGDTSKSCRTPPKFFPPKDSKGPRQAQHRDVAGASAAFINRWSHCNSLFGMCVHV
jgi:hypothetical protein